MKINVDFELCSSHANCMAVAPEVFKVDDRGFLEVLQEEPPESLRDKVQAAVDGCPTGAISVED